MLRPEEPGPPPSSHALLALVVSGLALTVLGLAVGIGPLPIDAADEALAGLRDRGAGAPILAAADIAGSLPIWASAVVLLALVIARRSPRLAVELALVSFLAEAAATFLKVVVARPRPAGGPTLDLLVAAGFPSGHVTRAAVLVGVVLLLIPWCARHPGLVVMTGLATVAVMGVARVSARAHHTSDVLGACLLAAALLAAWELVRGHWAPSSDTDVLAPVAARRAGDARGDPAPPSRRDRQR